MLFDSALLQSNLHPKSQASHSCTIKIKSRRHVVSFLTTCGWSRILHGVPSLEVCMQPWNQSFLTTRTARCTSVTSKSSFIIASILRGDSSRLRTPRSDRVTPPVRSSVAEICRVSALGSTLHHFERQLRHCFQHHHRSFRLLTLSVFWDNFIGVVQTCVRCWPESVYFLLAPPQRRRETCFWRWVLVFKISSKTFF